MDQVQELDVSQRNRSAGRIPVLLTTESLIAVYGYIAARETVVGDVPLSLVVYDVRLIKRWSSEVSGVFGLAEVGPIDWESGSTGVLRPEPSVTLDECVSVIRVTPRAEKLFNSVPVHGKQSIEAAAKVAVGERSNDIDTLGAYVGRHVGVSLRNRSAGRVPVYVSVKDGMTDIYGYIDAGFDPKAINAVVYDARVLYGDRGTKGVSAVVPSFHFRLCSGVKNVSEQVEEQMNEALPWGRKR